MLFNLKRPCAHCPFRSDKAPYLLARRAEEIAAALERSTFACHETTQRPQPRGPDGRFMVAPKSHCAGVLAIMLNDGHLGDLQQIAARLSLWMPSEIDRGAPVYASLEAFVEAHGGTTVRWIGGRTTRSRGGR